MKDECKAEIIIALINSCGNLATAPANVSRICEAYKRIEKAVSASKIDD